MFDFESTVASDSASRNEVALKTSRAALLAVQSSKAEQDERARRADLSVGAVRIELERLGGDTARAVEALADGLACVRGEIRRVEGAREGEIIRMREPNIGRDILGGGVNGVPPPSLLPPNERQKYFYDYGVSSTSDMYR